MAGRSTAAPRHGGMRSGSRGGRGAAGYGTSHAGGSGYGRNSSYVQADYGIYGGDYEEQGYDGGYDEGYGEDYGYGGGYDDYSGGYGTGAFSGGGAAGMAMVPMMLPNGQVSPSPLHHCV